MKATHCSSLSSFSSVRSRSKSARTSWVMGGRRDEQTVRIAGMNGDAILPAIHRRLAAALAGTQPRYRPLIVDGVPLGRVDDERAALLRAIPAVFDVAPQTIALAPRIARASPAERSAAL